MKKYCQILFALLSSIHLSYGTRVLPVSFLQISGNVIDTPLQLQLTESEYQQIQQGDDSCLKFKLGHELYQRKREPIGQYSFVPGNTGISEQGIIASVYAINRGYEVIEGGRMKQIRLVNVDDGSIVISEFKFQQPIDLRAGFYSFEDFPFEPMVCEVKSEELVCSLEGQNNIRLSSLVKTLAFAETLGIQTSQTTLKAYAFLHAITCLVDEDRWCDYYRLEQVLDRNDTIYSINFFSLFPRTRDRGDILLSRLFLENRSGKEWCRNDLLSRRDVQPKVFLEAIPNGFYVIRCQIGEKIHNFDPEFAFNMDFLERFHQLIHNHLREEFQFILASNARSNLPIEDVYRNINLRKAFEGM